ncbi:OTU (ovarian tumor)-like cysteine protease [Handroanthus impetiginosus]|uniref:ubiquitinyl hydrolase 1 n=1 Tax=Handroanthus impetiginosus TaxID=429701 RepID=A0A2G9H0N7_9LAMI|nr:OTU (ovarian tumor)-like cysteine protease [Handroanthus impetiginosus]
MTSYHLDPDVVRWNFHPVDVCSLSNDGAPETNTFYEDLPRTESVKEGFCNPTHSFVNNDEVLAHAYQEEISRAAASDASGFTSAERQHQNESILAQDWLGLSGRHSSSQFQINQEETGQTEPVFSDLGQLSMENVLLEIEDESDLDGELGKRLNQMVSVPHVPKINGEIPSVDEATSDHQRLLDRLQLYNLVELKILGDGNCQFRSLSDQIYRTPEHHEFVRGQVVNQLKSRPELYDNYVPMAYDDYLKNMSKSGEWGDHVTLQAAADCYGIKILVITSFKDTCYIEILPQIEKSKRIIFLSFWAEVHYNSIYPLGEFPVLEDKKKKRWWWK